MKNFTSIFAACTVSIALQAQSFDFSTNPFSNGWTSVDETTSSNSFTYSGTESISYNITSSTETAVMHTPITSTAIANNFCASFKITPSNPNNYNTFFPMLLAPQAQPGPDFHPWRKNPLDPNIAGDPQNINLIGVAITHSELKFLHREGNSMTSSILQSFSSPLNLAANTSYWVKLSVMNGTQANLSVYSDADMTMELRNQDYTIPDLGAFTELYITNCNGNSATDQQGTLDDYLINNCAIPLGLNESTSLSAEDITLFPDPTSGAFKLHLPEGHNFQNLSIYDASQRLVARLEVDVQSNLISYDCSSFGSGVYTIILSGSNSRMSKRLVVSK